MKINRHHQYRVWISAGCVVVLVVATLSLVYLRSDHRVVHLPLPALRQSTKLATFSEQPTRLAIKSIGVDAPIVALGLTKNGDMEAPNNNTDIGWYYQSAKAGETEYAMLLDGHRGVAGQWGVLRYLGDVRQRDEIGITTESGRTVSYQVREIVTERVDQVDMRRALLPYAPGSQSLTLITCDGSYNQAKNVYDKRTIVYAERIR